MRAGAVLGVSLVVVAASASANAQVPLPQPGSPCGGPLQPPCQQPQPQPEPQPQPQPSPPGTAAVALTASATDVLLRPRPTRIELVGQVSGAPSGTEVVLEATAPEYGKDFRPVRARVDAVGAVSFTVRPNTNTDYRLTIASGQSVTGASAPVSVRVYPSQHVSFYSNTGRTVRALFEVGAGPILAFSDGPMRPLQGPARRAWYYLLPRRSNRLRRIAHARLEDGRGCGVFCDRMAWAKLRITRALRRARGVAACAEGLAWVGAGVADPACGRRIVRWR